MNVKTEKYRVSVNRRNSHLIVFCSGPITSQEVVAKTLPNVLDTILEKVQRTVVLLKSQAASKTVKDLKHGNQRLEFERIKYV